MKKTSSGSRQANSSVEVKRDSRLAIFFYAGVYSMSKCATQHSRSKSKNKSTDSRRR